MRKVPTARFLLVFTSVLLVVAPDDVDSQEDSCFLSSGVEPWTETPLRTAQGAARALDAGFELCSSGLGYEERNDSLFYLRIEAAHDFAIGATVVEVAEGSLAGLDARAVVGSVPMGDGPYVRISVALSTAGQLQVHSSYRTNLGGPATLDAVDPRPIQLPALLRIRREGEVIITSYTTPPGRFLDHLTVDTHPTALAATFFRLGMAQASGSEVNFTSALFRDVSVDSMSPATPEIRSVEPFNGPVEGDTQVKIFGEGLEAAIGVWFGRFPASILSVEDDGLVVVAPPAERSGPVDIRVKTIESSLRIENAFVYAGGKFLSGDCNDDGVLDLSDGVSILGFLFLGNPPCTCRETAEVNGDGTVDISDPVSIFSFAFLGGPPPTGPFPSPGIGESPHLPCYREPLPVIEAISSDTLREGDVVTILGQNFSPVPEENLVFFGPTHGRVIRATDGQGGGLSDSLEVEVGPIPRTDDVNFYVYPEAVSTFFSCRMRPCSPSDLGIYSAVGDDRIRVISSDLNTPPVGSSRVEARGTIIIDLDESRFDPNLPVELGGHIRLPTVYGLSRGSFRFRFEHFDPVPQRSFQEWTRGLAEALEETLSGGTELREFHIGTEGNKIVLTVTPDLVDLIDSGRSGSGGQSDDLLESDISCTISKPDPNVLCDPDGLEVLSRPYAWCVLEDLVKECNGYPRWEYFLPSYLALDPSGNLFPLPNPGDVLPGTPSTAGQGAGSDDDFMGTDPEDGLPANKGVLVNKAAYCHIRRYNFFNVCKLHDYRLNGAPEVPNYPRSAIILKTVFHTEDTLPPGADKNKFYSYVYSGDNQPYYLTLLHFMTKVRNDWFWADIYNDDGLGGCGGSKEGMPASLIGTVWENYNLCFNKADETCGNLEIPQECPGNTGSNTCHGCHLNTPPFTLSFSPGPQMFLDYHGNPQFSQNFIPTGGPSSIAANNLEDCQ